MRDTDLRHFGVTIKGEVLDIQALGVLGSKKSLLHSGVVVMPRDDDLSTFFADQFNNVLVHGARHVDLGSDAEQGGHPSHGSAMVAVRGGIEGQRRRGEGLLDGIKRGVEGQVEALGHGPVGAP